jgi:hypothetical protein
MDIRVVSKATGQDIISPSPQRKKAADLSSVPQSNESGRLASEGNRSRSQGF